MLVYKFGGASLENANRIRNVAQIINTYEVNQKVVVASALGKTTNALEEVVNAFYGGESALAQSLYGAIENIHIDISKELLRNERLLQQCLEQLQNIFTEVEWVLQDAITKPYDYYYDQIVSNGELLSSTILYYLLKEQQAKVTWIDVRDVMRTDTHFRAANVDITFTQQQALEKIKPLLQEYDIVITQGFIGATDQNETTTLGREGSDYTAALLANMLSASVVTIWKDVASVMNADPRVFADVIPIPHLYYNEVAEMSYYGAQVIHPKTIKPLQNKNIPLRVKSFLDTSLPGTLIDNIPEPNMPPVLVTKKKQVLLSFTTQDLSFIEGKPAATLYNWFSNIQLEPNLVQNSALTLYALFDNVPNKIESLLQKAETDFDVSLQYDVELITLLNYTDAAAAQYIDSSKMVLTQKNQKALQAVIHV